MRKLFFTLLTFSLLSCNHIGDSNKIDQDTIDIYNLSLDNTIGSDTTWRYHLKLPPPMLMKPPSVDKVNSLENSKFLKWRDSVKAILDTAELFVVINRKIDTLSASDINQINQVINSKGYSQDKINGDTSFNETLKVLCNSKNNQDTLSLLYFRTNFNYKIYSDGNFPNDKLRKIGSVSFSKIAFNITKDKAAVYTSYICGGLCGSGQILFFIKQNGKWTYQKKWDMWVS